MVIEIVDKKVRMGYTVNIKGNEVMIIGTFTDE